MKRLEGLAKLTGGERYVDDLPLDGALWGMTVRSPVARGRVREVRFGGDVDWSDIVVVDHRELPGPNEVRIIDVDQPILVAAAVRHAYEPVVLLAHPSRERVRRACQAVEVVVEPEEPVLDFRRQPTPEQIQYGDDNVLAAQRIEKGDVEAALARAAHIVEGVYETGAQEHVYLENQGMVAWHDGDVLVVKGSMQCPYYVLTALEHALGRDAATLRVVHAPTGGGFGGKEEYPSVIALHTALLALKARRPVKMIYDRGEDMAATTKRHPAWIRHRTGIDRDGRLVAQDIEVVLDGGAYVTLSPVVLSRGIIHAAGPYACDSVRIQGRAMFSNHVPLGAFRGFGAPQTQFANERHMDVVARALDIDPVRLRRINMIRDGDTTSTGQVIRDGADRVAVLDAALDAVDWAPRRDEHAKANAAHPFLRRGLGLATFYHGAGFTGAGEDYLQSRVQVAGLPDGRVEVRAANTEMGQGTTTVLTQIAAHRLGCDAIDVVIAEPDTHRVPNSGPTVASRTVMVVGSLIERACDRLLVKLGVPPRVGSGTGEHADIGAASGNGGGGAAGRTLRGALRDWHRDHPRAELVVEAAYERPPEVAWDEESYRGDAYGAFAWAAYVAEVEVDLRTCATRVTDFVAVQEIGKVINETLARGQIQGGVVQGIGWALMEECTMRDGAMVNNRLTDYIIPTAADVPPIRVVFHEQPYAHGPQGAKGIGELPIDGPAPAILNAIADALGVEPTRIPLTPEGLHDLLSGAHG